MTEYSIIPYCEVNGVRNFDDFQIGDIYHKMVDDRSAERCFPCGDVVCARNFIDMFKSYGNQLYLVFSEKVFVAVVWLNNFIYSTAHMHFCVFKESWGQGGKIVDHCIKHLLNQEDDQGFCVTLIVGRVDIKNKLALSMVRNMKYPKEVGVFPSVATNKKTGELIDSVVFVADRKKVMEVDNEDL